MKIAINGLIIDTKLIYAIGKVSDKEEYLDDSFNEDVDGIWNYSFNIHVFNRPHPFCIYSLDTKIDRATRKQNLIDFRESIVKKWLEDQTDVPQYNI